MIEGIEVINTGIGIGKEYGQWPHDVRTRWDSNPRFCGMGINDPKGKAGTHMTGAPVAGCEKSILCIRSETEKSKMQKKKRLFKKKGPTMGLEPTWV